MRIQFSFVGDARLLRSAVGDGDLWVEMDVVPREGETVHVPGISESQTVVRTVVWFPLGDDPASEGLALNESDRSDPFVYVVLGEPRRM